MKYKILFALLLGSATLFSQSQNSGTTSVNKPDKYAVVVGISDYQNQDIPDLRYAHKDASAFADYLKSPAGGSLTDEQLKILLNENATTAQIAAALEWLVEVSQEGDQAVIYFSGHGDVETKTMFQLGYLLTWDSPARTYVAGAFPLSYLQAVVSTLSLQNKAEVALITDACRAGKLAGTNVGGAQITNANLSKQFASEVKILSCQPDEFSLEGTQWGGGRGVFSYHLLDGLYGMADNNEDLRVNLFEIGRYLEDKVSNETEPHSQFPMIVGSKNTIVAVVNETSLALLKEKRSKETPALELVEAKGFEDMILTEVDSIWQKKYRTFTAAVADGNLLDSPTGEAAAYDLYVELSQATELKKLHGTIQRNLAAALQDDAQQAINAYLEANPTELEKRYSAETNYERHPRYLRKAAEILGVQNFYYPYIMAKLYYFEGLQIRLDADKKAENASYEKAIELQTKALEFQEYAPFVLNELGVLHTRLRLTDRAVEYYDKAIELAPEWGLPYMNYCIEAYYSGDKEKAIEYGEKAIEHNSDFPQLYNLLAWIYADRNEFGSREHWNRQGVELSDDFNFLFNNLLTQKEKKEHYKRPIELLEKAVEIDSNYAAGHLNLGFCYIEVHHLEKAIFQLKKSIELDSTNHVAYSRLGSANHYSKNYEAGVKAYKKAIKLTLDDPGTVSDWYSNLGNLYRDWGKDDKALEQFRNAINASPYTFAHGGMAAIYAKKGDYEKAEFYRLQHLLFSGSNPKPYGTLADFYITINRPEDAELFYLKALEFQPDIRTLAIDLVHVYQKKGDQSKAQEWIQKYSFSKSELEKDRTVWQDFLKTIKNRPESPVYFPVNCVLLGDHYEIIHNKPERTNYLYKKAIEVKSENPTDEEEVFLAQAYLKLNDWKKAQEICPKNISSDDTGENFAFGEIYYKLNRFEKAEAYFQKYLKLSTDSEKEKRVGFHYYMNSDIALTEKYLRKALEINPRNWGPFIGLSLLHFAYGDYEKSVQIIDEGIQKYPNEIYLKATKAFILSNSDTPEEGTEAFVALEVLQPGSSKIGIFLKLVADGDYEAANNVREEVLEIFPKRMIIPWFQISDVKILVVQKDFSSAMSIIKENPLPIFTYGLLTNYPALAPLRETKEFKDYMQRNFPGKINQ